MNISLPESADRVISYGFDYVEWCKQQHFLNDYQGMALIGLALVAWAIFLVSDYIDDEHRDMVKDLSLQSAFLLTLGFAIMWLVTK